jgi:hypothetical protein
LIWHAVPQERHSGRRTTWSRLWTVTISCWTIATSCLPCARVKPRAATSSRSPDGSITITSTLRLDQLTSVSTRRKPHPILDPQPVKNSAGHTLPNTAPPIFWRSPRTARLAGRRLRLQPFRQLRACRRTLVRSQELRGHQVAVARRPLLPHRDPRDRPRARPPTLSTPA